MTTLSTTAGELALEEYRVELEGRAFTVLHTGAIVSYEDEFRYLTGDGKRLPYGIVLWPAAIALAHELSSRDLTNLHVLELGAGTGLPGIVAASRGARVVQTDRQELALHVSKTNAERNGVTTIEHRPADWTAWTDSTKYDVILASDVLYAENMQPHLREIFDRNLKADGRILLADPFRKASMPFLEGMDASGWRVTFNKWTVGITPPPRPVGVYDLVRAG